MEKQNNTVGMLVEKQYVMKCSFCKKLLSFEEFGSKHRHINNKTVIMKKKTCNDCCFNINDYNSKFKERHNGVSLYFYKLGKRN